MKRGDEQLALSARRAFTGNHYLTLLLLPLPRRRRSDSEPNSAASRSARCARIIGNYDNVILRTGNE